MKTKFTIAGFILMVIIAIFFIVQSKSKLVIIPEVKLSELEIAVEEIRQEKLFVNKQKLEAKAAYLYRKQKKSEEIYDDDYIEYEQALEDYLFNVKTIHVITDPAWTLESLTLFTNHE